MRGRPLVSLRLGGLRVAAIVGIGVGTLAAQDGEPRFGTGPWIFTQRAGASTAAATSRYNGRLSTPLSVRLDDGTVATVSVTPAPCGAGETCDSADCGCHNADRFLLTVARPDQEIARTHLWAAYGTFDVVANDLVGGMGDELLIVRALGRSAPPNGLDLKILQIQETRLIELLDSEQVAGNLGGTPMVCGQWRSRVTIDADGSKPRGLSIVNDVIVPTSCTLYNPRDAVTRRAEVRQLGFAAGRYIRR